MGTRSRNLAIVVAVAALGLTLAASASPTPHRLADARKSATLVDVELVIAVDVSYSMDPDEQALQREGYVLALTSKEFLQALRQGAHGKIGITYFEWAGQFDQKIIMPWRLIDGPESADAVAAEISRAPYRRASRTSFRARCSSPPLFDDSGYKGMRRVIDVSGDGTNNAGQLIVPIRDEVLAAGITINGLPIMLKRPYVGTLDIDELDVYYEDCVIGGPGAFVVPICERENSSKRRVRNWCLRLRGGNRKGGSFRHRRRRLASPAQSVKRCGKSAGAAASTSGSRKTTSQILRRFQRDANSGIGRPA
jgi:hypothetical protein